MQHKAVLRGIGGLVAVVLIVAPRHWLEAATTGVDLGNGVALELLEIQPGTFQQGTPASEAARKADETEREVRLTQSFSIGKYPVTRAQFARFVAETNFRSEAEKGSSGGFGWTGQALAQRKEFNWRNPGFPQTDEHPVTLVTYNDARAFLEWLSRKAGARFRLPTEAEWEYVCRAGANAAPRVDAVAWYKANSGGATHPVGQKAPNAWGVSDMLGNVWEWCEDWYGPYQAGPVTDPLQTDSTLSDKPRRVLRGGSWLREAADCRPAARYRNDPQSRNADNGFRVVRVASAAAPAPALSRPVPPASPAPAVEKTDLEADPSRPAAPVPPAPVRPTNSHPGSGLGVLALLGLGGAAVWGLFRGIFGRGTSGGGQNSASGGRPVYTRVVQDGFWIQGDAIARGATLACRYKAGGSTHETEVVYEPGPEGHFVFTGDSPTDVSVVTSDGSNATRQSVIQNLTGPRRTVRTPPPLSRGFSSHPPAY